MINMNILTKKILVGILVVGTFAVGLKTLSILHDNQIASNQIAAQQQASNPSTPAQTGTGSVSSTKPVAAPGKNTLAQVALHNTPADCYIVVLSKIYNVSSFLNQHPGGAAAITPYCGKDATTAFQTHGSPGGSNHSAYAYSLLSSYYVAPLSTATSASGSSGSTTGQTTQTKPATSYTLSVAISGSGAGTISGQSINCSTGICSAVFPKGTVESLSALPMTSSTFSGWSGSCLGTGNCSVTMNSNQNVTANFSLTQNTPTASGSYAPSEVATHNTQGDCWLIISGRVYNVTNFISNHPGGVNAIVSRCGTDATTAFTTSGGGGHAHSAYAQSLLPTYYVGNLNAPGGATTPPPPITTPVPPVGGGGRGNDD